MPTRLSLRAQNRATLSRQMLLAREKATVVKAVERLMGMQAQEPKPPFIGLWTRLSNFKREDLARALHKHDVVRATAMRGTIHLLSKKDYVRLRGAIQAGLDRGLKSVLRDRLDTFDLDRVLAEATQWFGAEARTFDELRDHLAATWPKGDVRAMAYAARLKLALLQVPTDATWSFPGAADFSLAEPLLGEPISTDRDASALVLRYLSAFGPATVADAQTWSGLDGLRPVFDALRPKLKLFEDERKRELFDLPDAPRPDEDTPAPVRFLPEFDNLVLAHADRTRLIADEHRPKVVTKNLRVRATFLVEGVVAGAWKIERKKTTATITLEPFGPLAKSARSALSEEGVALARFCEPDATKHEVR